MTKAITKTEIKPGDIIFSVGTIDPGICKKDLIEGFDKYSSGSYHRLVPLLNPVQTAQKVAGLGGNGHEDSVHAGVCIGYDTDGKTPIITDLHGYVQDMPIDKYYQPCSLRIYRPNISPEAFVAAREKLEETASEEDKKAWQAAQLTSYGHLNKFYIPGRVNARWNQEAHHVLKIIGTPSSYITPDFLGVADTTVKPVDYELICSKLVIQVYKQLLNTMDSTGELQSEYMNIFDQTSPKTLEGHLLVNDHFTSLTAPSNENIFSTIRFFLPHHPKTENDRRLLEKYEEINSTDENDFEKAQTFAAFASKEGLDLLAPLVQFLKSQDIHYKPPGMFDYILGAVASTSEVLETEEPSTEDDVAIITDKFKTMKGALMEMKHRGSPQTNEPKVPHDDTESSELAKKMR